MISEKSHLETFGLTSNYRIMASYSKPDVWVSVNIEALSFDVPTPDLLTCIVGEHYQVVKNAFAGVVTAGESGEFPYPKLPSSYNDTAVSMYVTPSGKFAPLFEMVLSNGDRVNVSQFFNAGTDEFNKIPITTQYRSATGALLNYDGPIYVTYRALSDRYSGNRLDLLTAASATDLISLFGLDSLGPANPLGFGMYRAIIQAGQAVAGAAVSGTGPSYIGSVPSIAEWSYVMDFLRARDVYEIVPMSQSNEVLDVTLSHVNAMSSLTGKSERRMVFAPKMGSLWPVRNEAAGNYELWSGITSATVGGQTLLNNGVAFATGPSPIGTQFTSSGGYKIRRVGAGNGSAYGAFIVNMAVGAYGTTITSEGQVFSIVSVDPATSKGTLYVTTASSIFEPADRSVRVGDLVKLSSFQNEEAPVSSLFIVSRAGSASDDKFFTMTFGTTTLMHSTGPYNNLSTLRVVRSYVGRDRVEGLRDMARGYGNERLVLLAPDTIGMQIDSIEHDLPAYYAAAQFAAEMCLVGARPAGAAPGARGLLGIRDPYIAPFASSRYFTETEIDTAASGGISFMVNARKGLNLDVRQALTTDMSSVEKREAIHGVERDFLARTLREALRPEVRMYRIDDSLLDRLMFKTNAVGDELTADDSNSRCFRTITCKAVYQHPTMPDAVVVEVDATHLYIVNNIYVTITVVI